MRQRIIEIKGLSRENLLGKYPLPIAVYLLMIVIVSLISSPFQRMMQNGATDLNITYMMIGLVGEIIVLLIAILFSAGLCKIHLNIARRQEPSLKDFVYPLKNHPDKFMGFGILIVLISVACSIPGSICLGIGAALTSVPLLIAGIALLVIGVILVIIIMLGFGLTTYILLDDPYGTKVIQAMKQSWQYMKKRKGTLFILYLSFIGLFLLGILSFGIGLLWIEQYYLQSSVVFYLKVKEEHMEYRSILEDGQEESML